MADLQYQTEVDNFIDQLTTKLEKDCHSVVLSYDQFKEKVLLFTTAEELNGYLQYSATNGVSVDNALICAIAFFNLRWADLVTLVSSQTPA